jgi:hypothetical protein
MKVIIAARTKASQRSKTASKMFHARRKYVSRAEFGGGLGGGLGGGWGAAG